MRFLMGNREIRITLFISFWFFFLAANIFGQVKELPQEFNPPRLVSDYINLLSNQEFQALESKLVAYNDSTSTQIAIVIERSTEGENIFTYAQRLSETWGIGQAAEDNGILILVAIEDRNLRIHTGYGAEGFLTDAMSKRIIDNAIAPNFKNGNYYAGLDRATDIIMQLGTGEYQANSGGESEFPVGLIVILVIIIVIVIIVLINQSDRGDDGGYWRGGRYDQYGRRGNRGGWIISSGSGGGSFGGGGFGGFGGGSFGGGGASGSW